MRQTLIICCLSCCLSLISRGQYDKYRFSRLDISQGLSNNEVTAILRDQRGFCWFGTMSGLNRWDGYTFKVFRHDLRDSSSLNDDFIVQILEGPGRTLWISTRKGFCIYDPSTEKFDRNARGFLHAIGIDGDSLTDIRRDHQGNYWFLLTGAGSGLYKYDAAARTTRYYYPHPGSMRSFAADTAGNWWIVYGDGTLEKMDPHTGQIIFSSALLQKDLPRQTQDYRVYVDTQGDCWLYAAGRQSGLIWFRPSSGETRIIRKESNGPHLNTNLITGIVQDDKGLIWISTDHGGINLLDKKDFSIQYLLAHEDDDKSLGQNSINYLCKDTTGVIWVGTYKRGASYYRENMLKFPLYRHQPSNPGSLPYDDVNRFVEDAKGNLYIGTNGGGLLYMNRLTGKYTRYQHDPANPNSLSNDVIVSLCIDQQQRLWIGTYYGGMDCFDGKRFIHHRHSEGDSTTISDDRVWEIKEDSHGRLWVGTLAAGLDILDRKRNVFMHYPPDPAANPYLPGVGPTVHSGYISDLVEDREGNLWVGTAIGIDVLEKATGRFRHYVTEENNPSSLSNNNVISIRADSRGLIWVGTREGLNLFSAKAHSFTTFRTEDGLPDNTILTILEDNDQQLWLSTPNGLSRVTVSTDPQGNTSCRFTNYDESHGLQGREFNENAALRTRAGQLIFGGANGFNIFDPQQLRTGSHHPQLVFTDLQVFNKTVGIGEKLNGHVILPKSITESRQITLRYNENVFSIGFAVLDFLNAQKVRYAYMLEGFNKDWLISGDKTRKAVYTNLDPGDYTFKVRTTGEDGSWNDEVLELNITILPPFWKTPLAYILYVVLLAGVLYLARRMILQRAAMRFALEQQRKEAQRLHELDMMKIRFFTNVSHEFRTPLSLILTPLDKIIRNTTDPSRKAQFNLIHRNARRLLNMVNQLLDFRKLEVQELRLNAGKGDIIRFLRELSFSFADIAEKKNIDFSFNETVASLYTSFDPDKIERIIFNLLSNAFKFTPENGTITVNVDYDPAGMLEIRVRDTGIGIEKDKQEKIFERFFQNDVPGSMVNQGSGIGLAITREFVRLHNGTIRVDSEPGKGSCFAVLLPIIPSVPSDLPAPVDPSSANPSSSDPSVSSDPATSHYPILNRSSFANSPAPSHPIPDIPSFPSSSAPSNPAIPNVPPIPNSPAPSIPSDPILNIPSSSHHTILNKSSIPSQPKKTKKSTILLVEDNEDFRFYLKDNLNEYFTIVEASNGKEGWQKTLSAHPDLVVSDISMPELTGTQLCKKIKEDKRTAFIPVILLTALLGEEQQLRGLETGAADYMTKPFNFEILLSRIRNLLAQQETARKTYQKQVEASPSSPKVESTDEKFVRQALDLVEKNMANPDFSVEEMSRELFISRVALYKKILALTGKTPIEFIRTVRLKRAAQLLEKNQFTVAEIAYEVGFNNPKYFSRYFKAEYGVLPSAWQKNS
jgi:signal transduction histidine kinase/ligand-binding sensor domain-containing protein/DNA-binding response OmpR family regulator